MPPCEQNRARRCLWRDIRHHPRWDGTSHRSRRGHIACHRRRKGTCPVRTAQRLPPRVRGPFSGRSRPRVSKSPSTYEAQSLATRSIEPGKARDEEQHVRNATSSQIYREGAFAGLEALRPAIWVVPALKKLEDRHPGLDLGLEA